MGHTVVATCTAGRAVSDWSLGGSLGTLVLTDGEYLCPMCGKFELAFCEGSITFD